MSRLVYRTISRWGPDGLTPSEIGARALDMLRRVPLPAGQRWFVLHPVRHQYVPLAEAATDFTAIVEQGRWPGDFGETDADRGYCVNAFTLGSVAGSPSASSLHIVVTAGATWGNSIEFEIGDQRHPPDYGLLDYGTYRDVLDTLVDVWPCPWAITYNYNSQPPVDLLENGPAMAPFGGAWIAYVSAPLLRGLKPPADLMPEPTAGGGRVLAAAQTLLDQSNADQMRCSRQLEAIMRERVGLRAQGLPNSLPARVGPA